MVPAGLTGAAAVLIAALLIDRLFGDPHTRWHPVALLGSFIGWWGRPGLYPQRLQRVTGVVLWGLTAALVTLPFVVVSVFFPPYLYLVCAPFLLKCCFAWRSLEEHTLAVVAALKDGVDNGRETVGMLVSRDTAPLDRDHILSAGYESMTENLTDSIISPLSFFCVFGLAGAAFLRAVNTMDAMLGYRDERERLGWCAARMDDICNYLPARLTALLLLLWFIPKGTAGDALRVMRRDGGNRPGFNGGIVMAAMAGGTGARFEKQGVYIIGDGRRTLDEAGPDILSATRAATIIFSAAACSVLFLLGTMINSTGI